MSWITNTANGLKKIMMGEIFQAACYRDGAGLRVSGVGGQVSGGRGQEHEKIVLSFIR